MLVVGHPHDLVGGGADGGQVVGAGAPWDRLVLGGDGHEDGPVAGGAVEVGDERRVRLPGRDGEALEVENDAVPAAAVEFGDEGGHESATGRGRGQHGGRPLAVELGAVVVGHDGHPGGAVEVRPG
jgi:hypothetical protein